MVECCVYWIRAKEHTDIFTEGYVGITGNFDYRMSQHISNCHNPKYYKNYRTSSREAIQSGNYTMSKVLIGSREYCLDVEAKLRPAWRIGWNLAKGGSGGYGKHGLTGTKGWRAYYSLLSRAESESEEFHGDWLGAGGMVKFVEFYNKLPVEGELTLKKRGLGYNPDNLIKANRSEILRASSAIHDIGDGRLYSIIELGEKFNILPNTISTNLSRGFTIRQSVGLDDKERHKEFSYEKEMAVYYLWNSPMTHHQIGQLVGLGKSTLRRQLKDYPVPAWLFSHCEVVDRYKPVARRIPRSRCFETTDEILDVEDAYLAGEAIHSISKRTGVSHDAIERILKELENANYY